jgi:hypothetical protein
MAVGPLSIKTRESAIEDELVRRVAAIGGRAEKVTVMGSRGFFDRLVVLPSGRIVFVELKRPRGGRLALHQKVYADNYRQLGCEVALVKNSADIDRLLVGRITPKSP